MLILNDMIHPSSRASLMNDPWTSVDPLGEALHYLRMSGVFYTRSEFTESWALALPAMPDCSMFHVVTSGRCWLEDAEAEPQLLEPGVFVLVPHGEGHRLSSAPGVAAADLFDLPREQISDRYEILRHGNGGATTHMICGAVRFDHPAAKHLAGLLPRRIVIESWNSPQMNWIQSTLRLMADETAKLQPGGEAVVTRLADILVIQAIRSWIANDPAAQTGWLGALQDPQIGRALLSIHRDPARVWTVATLASEVAMSRSAFAARFAALVGETPLRYIAQWRMRMAQAWIQEENTPLADLAERLGYQSEAAFNRAFKRIMGISPGAIRRKVAPFQELITNKL